MTRRRRLAAAAALIALAALLTLGAPAALAAAGGGSAGFSGGGGGGGGFSGGGHGGRGFGIYILFRILFDIAMLGHGLGLLILIGLALAYWFFRSGAPKFHAFVKAREQQGRAHRRDTRKRTRRVELAAAEAADTDPSFDPGSVTTGAAALFTAIQHAWDEQDRLALRRYLAPDLEAEWERRLDDYERKGWRNRSQPLAPPTVEYVGLRRGGQGNEDQDQVVVRIEARIKDYVVDHTGRHLKKRGRFTETVRLREYWTLQRNRDDENRWILVSIEQGAEGAHALKDTVVPTAWSDDQKLRDEAMIETATADVPPPDTKTAELASLDYAHDARAAANDLSLADGRFAPHVLEVAARRAVAAWAEAVDGSDAALLRIADPTAISDLLHPGDPSRRSRLVVRGPSVEAITIVALDPASEPPNMTIDVEITGHRYIEDRATTEVLQGNPARQTTFTERWTLALSGDATEPWRIAAVGTPARTA